MRGLVLEGGGMRSMYTAGVMDALLEMNIVFDQCHAISAGAINAVSFISKQKGRNLETMKNYMGDPRYLSFRSWLKTGSFFGQKFIFETIPNELALFDYEAFKKNSCELYAGVYRLCDGKVVYKRVEDVKKDVHWLKATSSLPILTKKVTVDGVDYKDGGVVDCLGFRNAMEMGCDKIIMVLTRQDGYVRGKEKALSLIKMVYRKYPKLAEDLKLRHTRYNGDLEVLRQLEKEGKILVIRPQKEVEVDRMETDKNKLEALYHDGYEDALRLQKEIISYLND